MGRLAEVWVKRKVLNAVPVGGKGLLGWSPGSTRVRWTFLKIGGQQGIPIVKAKVPATAFTPDTAEVHLHDVLQIQPRRCRGVLKENWSLLGWLFPDPQCPSLRSISLRRSFRRASVILTSKFSFPSPLEPEARPGSRQEVDAQRPSATAKGVEGSHSEAVINRPPGCRPRRPKDVGSSRRTVPRWPGWAPPLVPFSQIGPKILHDGQVGQESPWRNDGTDRQKIKVVGAGGVKDKNNFP